MIYGNPLLARQTSSILDSVPTANSNNAVKSGGVYSELYSLGSRLSQLESDSHAPLVFDTTPTANSTNPVTSDGIYTALYSLINRVSELEETVAYLQTLPLQPVQTLSASVVDDYMVVENSGGVDDGILDITGVTVTDDIAIF